MKRYLPQFFLFLLVLAAAITLACGSSTANNLLQTVSLAPAAADAQNYPGGEVQFTATGNYAAPPSPVSPLTATWGACTQDGSGTSEVSVSSSGVAHCAAGAVGTYMVWAFGVNPSRATCNVVTACGGGCGRVTGTAQLTCP